MELNLSKEKAYDIANKYSEKYRLAKNSSTNIDKCVTLYDSFYGINGFAWTVSVESPTFIPDETDETTYVISDESKQVEYVIGPDGFHLTNHLQAKNKSGLDEWGLLNEDFDD